MHPTIRLLAVPLLAVMGSGILSSGCLASPDDDDDIAEESAALRDVSSMDVDTANWMGLLPGITDRPLTQLPIPGTHDSASYSITSSSPWAVTGYRDFPELSRLPGWAVKPTAAGWSRTQPHRLSKQFEDGIRLVDLRFTQEPDGQIYLEHGLRGPDADEVLGDIAAFARSHPREILFIIATGFASFNADSHATLLAKMRAAFGDRMVPASVENQVTLRQLWALDRNVIVLYTNEESVRASTDLWRPERVHNPWPNVQTAAALLEANRAERARRDPKVFWNMSGTVTPNSDTIVNGFFRVGPASIQELMGVVHPELQRWLRGEFRPVVNIVNTDWYDAPWACGSSFVRTVLSAIDGARLPITCEISKRGAGTYWSWGDWSVHTYADFSWEAVPGASQYEISLQAVVGCLKSTAASSSTSSVRIDRQNQAWTEHICLGSQYDVRVRALFDGVWQAWSSPVRITL